MKIIKRVAKDKNWIVVKAAIGILVGLAVVIIPPNSLSVAILATSIYMLLLLATINWHNSQHYAYWGHSVLVFPLIILMSSRILVARIGAVSTLTYEQYERIYTTLASEPVAIASYGLLFLGFALLLFQEYTNARETLIDTTNNEVRQPS